MGAWSGREQLCDEMKEHSISLRAMGESLWRYRNLFLSMIRREVLGRYRGSVLGLFWSFFNPLLMLAIYTFAFGVIFQARWTHGSNSKGEFAIILFAGLMIYNLFSECINRAPLLILGNVNYVKKVVFPLEILPLVSMGSALFHLLVSLMVWFLFHLILLGSPPITAFLFPVVLFPLILFILGMSWLLASLGAYLRDVGHVVSVATTAMLFLSGIFFPLDAVPEAMRVWFMLNPLLLVIEQVRSVLIWGVIPPPHYWLLLMLAGGCCAWLGYAWFQKTRRGFADVI